MTESPHTIAQNERGTDIGARDVSAVYLLRAEALICRSRGRPCLSVATHSARTRGYASGSADDVIEYIPRSSGVRYRSAVHGVVCHTHALCCRRCHGVHAGPLSVCSQSTGRSNGVRPTLAYNGCTALTPPVLRTPLSTPAYGRWPILPKPVASAGWHACCTGARSLACRSCKRTVQAPGHLSL